MINKDFNPDVDYILTLPKNRNYHYETIDGITKIYYQMTEYMFNKHMSYCEKMGIEPIIKNRWTQTWIDEWNFHKISEYGLKHNLYHVCETNHTRKEYFAILCEKCCKKIHFRKPIGRLILNTSDKNMQVDHINGDVFDNRECNLRLCTRTQNNRNKHGSFYGSFSGVRNIYSKKVKYNKYWRVYFTLNTELQNKYGKKSISKCFPYTDDGLLMAKEWADNKRIELYGSFSGSS